MGSRWLLDIQVERPSRQLDTESGGQGAAAGGEREGGREGTSKDVTTGGSAPLPGRAGQSAGLAGGSLETQDEEDTTGEQRGPPDGGQAGHTPLAAVSQFRACAPASVSEARLHSAPVPPEARVSAVTAASLKSVLHKSSAGTVEILTCVRYRRGFSSFK